MKDMSQWCDSLSYQWRLCQPVLQRKMCVSDDLQVGLEQDDPSCIAQCWCKCWHLFMYILG